MIGEDLVTPSVDSAGEAGDFGDLSLGAPVKEHDQPPTGVGWVDRRVDVSEELLGDPRGADLAVGIAGLEELGHPLEALRGEPLIRAQEDAAGPVERVRFAAPVAEGGLLGAAAHVVNRGVGQLDGVEVVHDAGGVGQVLVERRPVARCGVQRGETDPTAPLLAAGGEPVA